MAVWWSGLLLFFGAAAAAAGHPPETDSYRAGVACFEQLDFDCSLDLLSVALQQTPPTETARLLDIRRKLAESYLALGQHDQAVAQFLKLLQVNPDYRVDAPGISPKILDALSEAREKLATRAPVERVPWVDVGVAAGAEFLLGDDSRRLRIGPLLELQAGFLLGGPWRIAAGFVYASHDLANGEGTIRTFGGWAGFGAGGSLGPVDLWGMAGIGAANFGVIGDENKTGLLLPLRLQLDFRLGSVVRLGVVLAPSWILAFGGSTTASLTLSAGVRVAAVF